MQLGELEPIDRRTIWVHEAHHFTPWLLDNAGALAKSLGSWVAAARATRHARAAARRLKPLNRF